jgi:hypothetical protein
MQGHDFYLGVEKRYSELNGVGIRFGGFSDVGTSRSNSSEKQLKSTGRNKN